MEYLSGGDDFENKVNMATDRCLLDNLDLHLRHIESEPNNSSWSRPASIIIQAELDRRHPLIPTEPIENFIWRHRDGS